MRLAAITCILLASLLAVRPAHAIPEAGFAEMIASEAPRESFTLYRWDAFPDVYVIHFDTYLYQSRAFSRMAMWQEMAASRGRIMTQSELEAWFSGQGATLEGLFGAHDYDTEDLAAFYNALWQSGEPLYDEEQRVAEVLVGAGLLVAQLPAEGEELPRDAAPFAASGEQAVISFATRLALRDSANNLQGKADRSYEAGALYHEMLHGIFFTEPEYARRCTEFWQQRLSADERRAFSTLLASLNYDPAFETLMVNEFQAYILTPRGSGDSTGSGILLARAKRLLKPDYRPRYVSEADKAHFLEHGEELISRISGSLGDELHEWLGDEYLVKQE
ncbi:MAG: hypothetical protein H7A35_04895 [Planctomycetales bacterium]|nr:hypothetical protein [bacterium]UNM09395.1 MAG: hypothetical protein H7A35_04895 [Planctomycetales bacterium]